MVALPLFWAVPASARTEQTPPRQRYIVLMRDDATPMEVLAAQLKLLDLDALIRGILHSADIFLADISSAVLTDIRDQPEGAPGRT